MAERGANETEFSCARDRVRFQRLTHPSRAGDDVLVLHDGESMREVGTGRARILEEERRKNATSAQRRIRILNSRKVLRKEARGGEAPPLTRESTPEGDLAPEGREDGDEEAVVPSPVRISTSGAVPSGEQDLMPSDAMHEEDEDEYFTGDTMCAWCDDGGDLVMCDGPCLRGFHMDGDCNPLDVPPDLKAAIVNSKHPFECPNCWSRTHRCFSCNGSFKMDVTSDNPQLVKCDFADCGKFYCIGCQEKIEKRMEMNFQLSSRSRSAFICPLHYCCNCGTWEDASTDILFPCRRCPRAMHEKCMPKKIRENPTRIWKAAMNPDGTLSEFSQVSENFFYCSRHEAQNMLQGPVQEVQLFSSSLYNRWRTAYALKFRCLKSSEPYIPDRRSLTLSEDLSVALAALDNQRGVAASPVAEAEAVRLAQKKRMRAQRQENEAEMITAMSEILQDCRENGERRSQLRAVMESAMTTITLTDVEKELTAAFPYHRRHHVKLTEDRLDFFIHSVERAKSDSRLSVDQIPSGMVQQMTVALKSMRVSCAPFLQSKYTSYGRHFTKTSILRHIANILIGYLRPNDLVVDFSCGANEFIGIINDFSKGNNFKVRVRAYDLFTPIRMDGFVRKNWFQVSKEELDKGERLVVGLNPPFGIHAYLANHFISHAAKFKPRVLFLICPPETAVPEGYKIVHEDMTLCKDKAFYIPGLRADQWNEVPPPFRVLMRDSKA